MWIAFVWGGGYGIDRENWFMWFQLVKNIKLDPKYQDSYTVQSVATQLENSRVRSLVAHIDLSHSLQILINQQDKLSVSVGIKIP